MKRLKERNPILFENLIGSLAPAKTHFMSDVLYNKRVELSGEDSFQTRRIVKPKQRKAPTH